MNTVVDRRAGVLGRPIAHSLSPVIHNAGYVAAGLTGWSYRAYECAEAELAGFVGGLDPSWVGLSLTMPLKEVALRVADEVSPVAAAIGAANTLVRRPDGGWRADNTDAPGMVDALVAAGVARADRVCILGAGGTARAALAAAAQLGAGVVTVVARRLEAVKELDPIATDLGLTLIDAGWADAEAAIGSADVVVSTVPRGVADQLGAVLQSGTGRAGAGRAGTGSAGTGRAGTGPAGSGRAGIGRAGSGWRTGAVLFDAIYDPWPTPLAASAAAAGCQVVSGLDLLLAQAVRQFELFTRVDAPVPAMRDALHSAAAHR
jgi:shikimate dehydrogenase